METYDIYFKEGNDFANKGFSLKDKAKAIRMAEDMLAERKGYVKDFVGGTISVMCKETKRGSLVQADRGGLRQLLHFFLPSQSQSCQIQPLIILW